MYRFLILIISLSAFAQAQNLNELSMSGISNTVGIHQLNRNPDPTVPVARSTRFEPAFERQSTTSGVESRDRAEFHLPLIPETHLKTQASAGSLTYDPRSNIQLRNYRGVREGGELAMGQGDQRTQTDPTGALFISSTPPGANITLNKRHTGQKTPATIADLTTGANDLLLELTGYLDLSTTVRVRSGQTSSINVILTAAGGDEKREKPSSNRDLEPVAGLPVNPNALNGKWLDSETNQQMTVLWTGSEYDIKSIVDHDGEELVVSKVEWENGDLSWTYRVPSSGFIIDNKTTALDHENIEVEWSNNLGLEGTRCFTKVESFSTIQDLEPSVRPSFDPKNLNGLWVDSDTKSRTQINWTGSKYDIKSIVSSTGQEYIVSEVKWRDGTLSWTYKVPSTGYIVNNKTLEINADKIKMEWSNNHNNEGTKYLNKVESSSFNRDLESSVGPSFDPKSLNGVWVDSDTKSRTQINWTGSEYDIKSIVSSSGQEYIVSEVKWRDGMLSWTYKVPSTGYILDNKTLEIDDEKIEIAWSNNHGSKGTNYLNKAETFSTNREQESRANVSFDPKNLNGVWLDSNTKSRTTIKWTGSEYDLVSIIDNDGEEFTVSKVKWRDGTLSWTYKVPSTGYIVNNKTLEINADKIKMEWSNNHNNEGTKYLNKVESFSSNRDQEFGPSVSVDPENLNGVWIDSNTQQRMTIKWTGSEYDVVSIFDDDGEKFVVTKSEWRNGVLSWTYRVPSTGYVLDNKSTALKNDKIEISWSNNHGGSGDKYLSRAKGSTQPSNNVDHKLVGNWLDGTTKYRIESKGSGYDIVSVVARDGEKYRVSNVSWNNGVLSWTYHVPSTGYVLENRTIDINQDEMEFKWSNNHGASGTDLLKRTR